MGVEDRFLDHLVQTRGAVTVFLLNGVKLQGQILETDDRTLLLKREAMTQLVFKHAISTIMPINPVGSI